jgi:phospholipid/cholesterol/gamma-HCH transport system substrate-binding protein
MSDYQKRFSWAKMRVGIVVTTALFVLLFTVLFAGNVERLFSPRATVFAVFNDVKGLRPGAPVWFAGVQIGSVRTIRLAAGEKITVSLTIDRDALSYLKKDSRIDILTLGLLGDKYIEVGVGSKEAAALRSGDTITGTSRPEIGEELSRLVDIVESPRGSVGRLFKEDALYRDLSASVRDIRLFAETLKASEGTVNKFIKDPAVYQRFLTASESLDVFARKLTTSKGTVNRLIEDDGLYENVNAAAARLNALLAKIEKGEGTMGSFVAREETGDELRATIKELNGLIKDIKENPKRYFSLHVF